MTLDSFFEAAEDEKDLSYCEPLYYVPKIPGELNPQRVQVINWTEDQLNTYLKKLQTFLVDLFEHQNISFFGSTMEREDIQTL